MIILHHSTHLSENLILFKAVFGERQCQEEIEILSIVKQNKTHCPKINIFK